MRNLILLLLFGSVISCQKLELPDPVEEAPIFGLEVSWGDGEMEIFDATNRYALVPILEQDSNGVTWHRTQFIQEDCLETCGGQWEIVFRNAQLNNTQANVQLQNNSEWPFLGPLLSDTLINTHYRADLTAALEGSTSINAISWTANGDLLPQTDSAFSIEYDSISGPLEVCIQMETDECTSYQCRRLELTENVSTHGQIRADGSPALAVLYADITGGVPPYSQNWSNGATDEIIVVNSSGEYCLEVLDVAETPSTQCVYYETGEGLLCAASYDYEVHRMFSEEIIVQGDPNQLGTMEVIYTDPAGEVYRSGGLSQSATAYFQVQEAKSFAESYEGRPVWQLSVDFKVDLMSSTGELISIEQAQGTWAFAYE